MAGSATITGRQNYVLGIGHPVSEPTAEGSPATVVIDTTTGGSNLYGVVVVPDLVVGDPSAATANTSKIQVALTTAGIVLVATSGVIYINDTLKIYSGTQLTLGPKTIIKLAPGTSKVMLTTESQYQSGVSVSLAWTAGTQTTVTWVAHGKSVGDYVWLIGATEARYRGVFRVDGVTDADNLVINLATVPLAAPSGTITAKTPTKDLIVEGGTWDYDYPNNNGANLDSFAMSIHGAANVAVRDVNYGKSSKYSLTICAFLNASVKRVNSNTTSDCVKVYGPGNGFELDGLTGTSGDDIFSVQAQEGTPYVAYQIQTGDLHQIVSKNINGRQNGTTSNINIYLSDNCVLYGLVVDGVGGTGLANLAVAIQKSVGETTGYAESVELRNISTSGVNAVYWASGYISKCVINGVQANPHLLSNSPVVNFTGGASCGILTIADCNFKKSGWPSSGTLYAITLTGAADVVNVLRNNFKNGGGGGLAGINVNTGCSVKTINAVENNHGGNIFVYVGGAPTVTPQINIRGNNLDCANPIFIAGNVNVSMTGGNRITNASGGVIKFNNTFTVNLSSDGSNNLVAGSWLSVVTGTPVFGVKGWDVALDVGATGVSKINGSYCFNNGAARGTLTQNRLVTCNGTNWVQVDTPANVF